MLKNYFAKIKKIRLVMALSLIGVSFSAILFVNLDFSKNPTVATYIADAINSGYYTKDNRPLRVDWRDLPAGTLGVFCKFVTANCSAADVLNNTVIVNKSAGGVQTASEAMMVLTHEIAGHAWWGKNTYWLGPDNFLNIRDDLTGFWTYRNGFASSEMLATLASLKFVTNELKGYVAAGRFADAANSWDTYQTLEKGWDSMSWRLYNYFGTLDSETFRTNFISTGNNSLGYTYAARNVPNLVTGGIFNDRIEIYNQETGDVVETLPSYINNGTLDLTISVGRTNAAEIIASRLDIFRNMMKVQEAYKNSIFDDHRNAEYLIENVRPVFENFKNSLNIAESNEAGDYGQAVAYLPDGSETVAFLPQEWQTELIIPYISFDNPENIDIGAIPEL